MRNNKGFTLIELLIVVVIIGILAAIAIPKFSEAREKAFISAMKSDLKNLATQEELYYADNFVYSTDKSGSRVLRVQERDHHAWRRLHGRLERHLRAQRHERDLRAVLRRRGRGQPRHRRRRGPLQQRDRHLIAG